MGGLNIDLDADNGTAAYVLGEPQTIDLALIEKAAFGAGYNLQWVELTISGRTVQVDGEMQFEASSTKQRFLVNGHFTGGDNVTLKGKLTAPEGADLHQLTLTP